jgi:hypothetical protein
MSTGPVFLDNDLTVDDEDRSPASGTGIPFGGPVGEHACLRSFGERGQHFSEGQVATL